MVAHVLERRTGTRELMGSNLHSISGLFYLLELLPSFHSLTFLISTVSLSRSLNLAHLAEVESFFLLLPLETQKISFILNAGFQQRGTENRDRKNNC